ncbi:MAG: NUDIX domain-containing protein [Clostridia bacterium]|nr:NUDIX domain-containing protein [Clostridia bacterium]
MFCTIHPLNSLGDYIFVVTLSEYRGKLLLSRHRRRDTWETQGGHIEPDETPLAAARRELYEESGATAFAIEPLCDYRAGDGASATNGMVFVAKIAVLGDLPDSEMAEVRAFDGLPANLTYGNITPKLYAEARRQGYFPD